MLGKRKRGGSKAGNAFKKIKPVEEVTFDFDKRQDYLTGFHKRKLQRIKHAQDEAAKKQREERIQERKQLRETRQKELAEHVKAVNVAVRRAEGQELPSEGDDADSDDKDGWQGIEESTPKVVNHADEYSDSDEDQEATVTVEAVDVDRDGMHAIVSDGDSADEDGEPQTSQTEPTGSTDAKSASKRVWSKEKPKLPKKKKKKFRYESKGERKLNRVKEKAKKAKKASKRTSETE